MTPVWDGGSVPILQVNPDFMTTFSVPIKTTVQTFQPVGKLTVIHRYTVTSADTLGPTSS